MIIMDSTARRCLRELYDFRPLASLHRPRHLCRRYKRINRPLGEQINREQYTLMSEACVLLNYLVDFHSDTMRKLRENVILRGICGNLCKYLDGLIWYSLLIAEAIKSRPCARLWL